MNYLYPGDYDSTKIAFQGAATYYVLLNQFVPLAVVVLVEVSKLIYTWFIEWDASMFLI